MTDEKKPDYSRVKTHGGVTTNPETGETYPTGLTDEGRAAQVQALKNEQSVLKQRVDGAGDDGDHRASKRLAEVDRTLASLGERPPRGQKPEQA